MEPMFEQDYGKKHLDLDMTEMASNFLSDVPSGERFTVSYVSGTNYSTIYLAPDVTEDDVRKLRRVLDTYFAQSGKWTRHFSSTVGQFYWFREYEREGTSWHIQIWNAPTTNCTITKRKVESFEYVSDCQEIHDEQSI